MFVLNPRLIRHLRPALAKYHFPPRTHKGEWCSGSMPHHLPRTERLCLVFRRSMIQSRGGNSRHRGDDQCRPFCSLFVLGKNQPTVTVCYTTLQSRPRISVISRELRTLKTTKGKISVFYIKLTSCLSSRSYPAWR